MISMVSLDYSGICTSSRSELPSRKKEVYYVAIICNYALALLHKPINLNQSGHIERAYGQRTLPQNEAHYAPLVLKRSSILSGRFSGIYYFRPRTFIRYLVRTEFTHSGIDLTHSCGVKDFSDTYYPCHADSRYAMNAANQKKQTYQYQLTYVDSHVFCLS